MPSSAIEDYVKQLYFLQQGLPTKSLVPMGQLASAMRVTPGTATTMVKTLTAAGLSLYTPRAGVRLSANGENLALAVLRRHRLIELFLVNILHLDWSEVHEEAEALEHVISDRVLARMDELLGHPTDDPHGSPIPSAEGVIEDRNDAGLNRIPVKQVVEITRVKDADGAFLQFLGRNGLTPGVSLEVVAKEEAVETLEVRIKGETSPISLSLAAAQKIHVSPPRQTSSSPEVQNTDENL